MADRAFEDFELGETIETAGRTVDVSDIQQFAGLTGDNYPLHTNEEYAKKTQFGGRIAHGPLTFSIAVGQVALTGWYGDAIIALIECQSMRATAPVRPGDTIRVRATVTELGEAKNPKNGTLHVDYDVVNQSDETVMTFHWVMLARRRVPLENKS
jgi:acyl dehydratase